MFTRLTFWLAVIGIISATMLLQRLQKADPNLPPVAEPPRALFANGIGARGLIESIDENVRIAPAVPGLVQAVHVQVGKVVAEGDPLIELDQRDARAFAAVQESAVAAVRAQILEAEVTLADRKDQWNRIEKLSVERVASVDEKQRAFFGVRAAESRLTSLQAQMDNTKALAERARVQLDLLTIRAPRAGRVLQVNIRAGEFASAEGRDPLILMGKDDTLQLRVDVDENNASQVREGAAAEASPKGLGDRRIPLRFVRIDPYIVPKRSLSGDSMERVDTRVLQIIYQFDRPAFPVYVGQQMDVFIKAEEPAK